MRQQVITIPLLNVLVQWIRDRLNEKSNTNHTHGAVTTTQNGFMTSADKTKVNAIPTNPKYTDTVTTINGKTGSITKSDITALGIPAQDTVYTHPSTHPASMITQDSARRMVSDTQIAAWNDKASATHTHTAAQVTQSSIARFVTDAEKTAWNNKIGKEGGSMTGGLIVKPSGDTRQTRNIAIGTTAPTSTTGHTEGDIFLVVP